MESKPDSFWYIILYLIPIIGAIAVAVIFKDQEKRMRFHMYQSSVEGIILVVLFIIGRIISVIIMGQIYSPGSSISGINSAIALDGTIGLFIGLIAFILWIYGLFIGFRASQGSDIKMAIVGNITERITGS
jgi:uncharacterized membrane protein